jgi:uncharacterized iron-regulated protein
VALALEFDLPIIAANLSRADAMHVATDGWTVLFDAATSRSLHLDKLPADYLHEQQQAIAAGHCNQLPADEVPALVRAQAARDITLARSIQPYADRGVVLLTGNGHARRDVGVRFWLPRGVQRRTISIGMLERDDDAVPESAGDFDAYVMTERADRQDPCKELTRQLRHSATP